MTPDKVVWSLYVIGVLLVFAVFEISGYFGAPWGTLTVFIRSEEQVAGIIKWILLFGLSILTVHLVGDWP